MTEKHSQKQSGIHYATASDVGMRRTNNQDSCIVVMASDDASWQRRGHLFMVADGMGAHAAGELASKMAVDGVSHRYRKYAELSPEQALAKALDETNTEVHRRGNANLDFRNMGTTASAMAILPQGVIVAHIGDSRIYRVRGAQIEQLTFDHSLVWELQAAGKLPVDEAAAGAIPKNVITRSLGPSPHVQIDLEGPFPIEVGDTFLLCSDGLSGQITDEERGAIAGQLEPEEACQLFIDLANLRGGPDNITVVLARVIDPAVVQAQSSAPPLGDSGSSPIHPAVWITGLLVTLGGIGLSFVSMAFGVILATLGGLLLLGAAFKAMSSPADERSGAMLGKGPYRRHTCPVSDASVEALEEIVSELRQAAKSEGWTVDWDTFEGFSREAREATIQQDHKRALQALARAVSFMMEELRMQDDRNSSDSAIDY